MLSKFTQLILFITALLALGGCQKLQLKLQDASVQPPANVVVYFTVDAKDGEPLPLFTAENFKLYEDGHLLALTESRLTMLEPKDVRNRYTLVLVDLSAPTLNEEGEPVIIEALDAFIDKLGDDEKIAVFGFAGRKKLYPAVNFTHKGHKRKKRLNRLAKWDPMDKARNLHGAIAAAAAELKTQMEASKKPLNLGTLVVFTEGFDNKGRLSISETRAAVREADIDTYMVTLKMTVDPEKPTWISHKRIEQVAAPEALKDTFVALNAKIQQNAARFYLLSYCSPSVDGNHEVKVEAMFEGDKGKFKYDFDVEGFTPGCDPTMRPRFGLLEIEDDDDEEEIDDVDEEDQPDEEAKPEPEISKKKKAKKKKAKKKKEK